MTMTRDSTHCHLCGAPVRMVIDEDGAYVSASPRPVFGGTFLLETIDGETYATENPPGYHPIKHANHTRICPVRREQQATASRAARARRAHQASQQREQAEATT